MQNDNVLYYDGISTRAVEVRVLLYNSQLHVVPLEDMSGDVSYPFSGMSVNQVGNVVFLYLDKTGLKYVTYDVNHTLAKTIASEMKKSNSGIIAGLLRQRGFVLLLILSLLAATLYFSAVNLIPFIGSRLISLQQEIELGEKLKNVTLEQEMLFGNKVDTKGSKILQEFASRLDLSRNYPINITVVNSDLVNAYALPGGHVVVYRGILKKIKTPEQLTALLAHESSHINERHTLRSMLRRTANAIIISVVFGDASGISGAVASKAETLNSLRYSRSLENEADNKGMELMLANKVGLHGMIQLMQMLQDEDKVSPGLAFFSSHPLTKERLAAAVKYAPLYHNPAGKREDLSNAFSRLQKRLQQ